MTTIPSAEYLADEHRLVLRFADQIETRARQVLKGDDSNALDCLDSLLDFLSEYTQPHHEAKEERYFYPWIERIHLPRDPDVLERLQAEHWALRDLTRHLRQKLPDLATDPDAVARSVLGLATFLRHHVHRENELLLTACAELEADDTEMAAAFARLHVEEEDARERFRTLLATSDVSP